MKDTEHLTFNDSVIDGLLAAYFKGNEAASTFVALSERESWPLTIDHIAFRCLDIDRRAQPFIDGGYVFEGETVTYPDQGWWAKIYRKSGCPALFVDQAYDDARGEKSIIPQWVEKFGENDLHHAAMRVEDIDQAIHLLKKAGVEFAGPTVGNPGSRLRQIFSASEIRDGAAYTVLELTERNGYTGFYHDQANRLMQSSVKKKSS